MGQKLYTPKSKIHLRLSGEYVITIDNRLESLDDRLRNVEVDVAEIKGQKAGWDSALHYCITIGIALVALGVAIAVALWK